MRVVCLVWGLGERIKMKLDFSNVRDAQTSLDFSNLKDTSTTIGMLQQHQSKPETPEEASEQILDRNIINFIKKNEGLRLTPYKDTVGVLTVGFGHTGDDVVEDRKITTDEALSILENDYRIAKEDARSLIPNFDNLNDSQKTVFTDMSYNLGKNRLAKFKKMLAAIESDDWDKVVIEMQDSKWYNQVGDRSKRLVDIIKQSK